MDTYSGMADSVPGTAARSITVGARKISITPYNILVTRLAMYCRLSYLHSCCEEGVNLLLQQSQFTVMLPILALDRVSM